jgi:poly(hydroxyalkanoate) depolymerase family esterase
MDTSLHAAEAVRLDGLLPDRASGSRVSKGLQEKTDFGSNPGALRMLTYVPHRLAKSPALVVVLHGCTQTAESYDKGAGWSKLADRGGFVLVYPEQRRSNNAHGCFNWFVGGDTQRGSGEVASIHEMITDAIATYGIDRRRIFICGLSAGGAMAGAMLATYPETFKAGAILAGLPYGAASTTGEALESMYSGRLKAAKSWGDLVRAASPHTGPWPSVAVWHGTADSTVKPINAGEIIKQWTDVHGLVTAPDEEQVGEITRRSWRNTADQVRVLDYSVPGMAHGTPVEGLGQLDDGAVGPFFLAAGLWSSLRIAQDWGLFDKDGRPSKPKRFWFLGRRF